MARRLSGTTIRATVAAGTRIPPTPKPAMVPIATTNAGFVGSAAASAPPKTACICQSSSHAFRSQNLLIMIADTSRIHLASMRVERSALKNTAPAVTEIP